jgi:hypothetical protein
MTKPHLTSKCMKRINHSENPISTCKLAPERIPILIQWEIQKIKTCTLNPHFKLTNLENVPEILAVNIFWAASKKVHFDAFDTFSTYSTTFFVNYKNYWTAKLKKSA